MFHSVLKYYVWNLEKRLDFNGIFHWNWRWMEMKGRVLLTFGLKWIFVSDFDSKRVTFQLSTKINSQSWLRHRMYLELSVDLRIGSCRFKTNFSKYRIQSIVSIDSTTITNQIKNHQNQWSKHTNILKMEEIIVKTHNHVE